MAKGSKHKKRRNTRGGENADSVPDTEEQPVEEEDDDAETDTSAPTDGNLKGRRPTHRHKRQTRARTRSVSPIRSKVANSREMSVTRGTDDAETDTHEDVVGAVSSVSPGEGSTADVAREASPETLPASTLHPSPRASIATDEAVQEDERMANTVQAQTGGSPSTAVHSSNTVPGLSLPDKELVEVHVVHECSVSACVVHALLDMIKSNNAKAVLELLDTYPELASCRVNHQTITEIALQQSALAVWVNIVGNEIYGRIPMRKCSTPSVRHQWDFSPVATAPDVSTVLCMCVSCNTALNA